MVGEEEAGEGADKITRTRWNSTQQAVIHLDDTLF